MQTSAPQLKVSNFVDYILQNAIKHRASDIHLDPDREKLHVRFRIDGILYTIESFDSFSKEEITTRVKVLSLLDIAEHRFPQDGHFEYDIAGRIHNVRVSILPTIYGEAIVMRIFNRGETQVLVENLGFEKDQMEIMNQLLASPDGMILTTGPTGSGKTTLLYAILNKYNKIERNIVTLEDPVENQVDGIRQTQINENIGFTFAKALRSVVRQDPDIVMLGEIRDTETAQLAIQAALTGILVLSTFHTFDVPALVTRLMEIGFSGSVVAQSIKGVVSTRLVRKICEKCKVSYSPGEEETQVLSEKAPRQLFKGEGCEVCSKKGYIGRIGIFEVIYFDEEIKSYITEKRPASEMYKLLHGKNIKTLKEVAINKAISGETTVEEVVRVSGSLS